jgi:hypothetical protein
MSVFYETWRVHIEYRDLHAKFFKKNFYVQKIFFSAVGAYTPMS